MSKRLDLTGKKFGKLTVVKEVEQKGYNRYWQCECDCGTVKNIRQSSLTSGNSKSCGCDKKRKVRDLTGERFGILTALKVTGRKNGKAVWKCKCDCGNYTDVVSAYLTSGQTKSCGCLKKKQEKINLRDKYAEKYVDNVNTSLLKSKKRVDNKSGVKGVSLHKSTGKWDAYIGFKGRQIFLGRFKNIEDAIKARKEAEEKYHKPYLEEEK